MTGVRKSAERQRGEIEALASGSLRVKVYAGIDPLSGKRHYLTETVPAGPRALAEARKVRTRLLSQIDEQRSPGVRVVDHPVWGRHHDAVRQRGGDPDGGDHHAGIGPGLRGAGPARDAARAPAQLPQPDQPENPAADQHRPPDRLDEPDQPGDHLHRGEQRGRHQRQVRPGHREHRSQPDQGRKQPQHQDGRGAGSVDRGGEPVHPAPVPQLPRPLRAGLPVGQLLVVPERLGYIEALPDERDATCAEFL